MSSTAGHRWPGRPARLWSDVFWPTLAGCVTATGVMGAAALWGIVGLALITAGLWLFMSIMVFGVASESGMRPVRATRLGLVITCVVIALCGLTELFPLGGWIAAAALAVTSPMVTDRIARHGRDARTRQPQAAPAADQAAVDREFARMVAQLGKDLSSGSDGS
jgi:hypothetical protein